MLCNIAASEILMPTGFAVDPAAPPTIDSLLKIQEACQVSVEAAALRLVRSARYPCAVAVASRVNEGVGERTFRADYVVTSRAGAPPFGPGALLEGSVFSQCIAVGCTAKGREPSKGVVPSLYWECVGLPPYPGKALPRVLGLCRMTVPSKDRPSTTLELRGDALQPRGAGPKIVAQVVNDKTANWGGAFSKAVRGKFPQAQEDFRRWASEGHRNLSLGRTRIAQVSEGLSIASMVAQHGYGPSDKPRIRYAALNACLATVRDEALRAGASIHMPRIGAGMAGGNWSVISELIDEHLSSRGVPVTVYTPPARTSRATSAKGERQSCLSEDWSGG